VKHTHIFYNWEKKNLKTFEDSYLWVFVLKTEVGSVCSFYSILQPHPIHTLPLPQKKKVKNEKYVKFLNNKSEKS
jgi:hypothetical protein